MNNESKKKRKKQNKVEKIPEKQNILKKSYDNSEIPTNGSIVNLEEDNKIKRNYTKYVKSNKNKKEESKNEEVEDKTKKVRFGNVQIIDVECWKEINLKLTAEENMEEIIKLTEGKGDKRTKNIGCTCIII